MTTADSPFSLAKLKAGDRIRLICEFGSAPCTGLELEAGHQKQFGMNVRVYHEGSVPYAQQLWHAYGPQARGTAVDRIDTLISAWKLGVAINGLELQSLDALDEYGDSRPTYEFLNQASRKHRDTPGFTLNDFLYRAPEEGTWEVHLIVLDKATAHRLNQPIEPYANLIGPKTVELIEKSSQEHTAGMWGLFTLVDLERVRKIPGMHHGRMTKIGELRKALGLDKIPLDNPTYQYLRDMRP